LKIEDEEAAQKLGWSHITADGWNYDPNGGNWEGWMWVGNIIEKEVTKTPVIRWVEIRPDGLKTFDK